MPPEPVQDKDAAFRAWYADRAKRLGLNPNPDDPRHRYDYRAAFAAGVEPDESGHWPSEFKAPDHPRRFLPLGPNGETVDTAPESEHKALLKALQALEAEKTKEIEKAFEPRKLRSR